MSFDGLSFGLSPEVTKRGWQNNDWFHTDQSYTRNSFECIQSWATGLDVNEGDATLAILEGSNKYHKDFSEEFKISNKLDWYKLNENEIQYYLNKGCKKVLIQCKAESMVFCDSRTIHCGYQPIKGRKESNNRAVIYLCYTPKSLCNKSMLAKRKNAFDNLRTTNHWPHKVHLFPKIPRTYGKPVPNIKKINHPNLTELGKSLI